MSRTCASSTDQWNAASAPFTANPFSQGVWANMSTVGVQALQFMSITDGTSANVYRLGNDVTGTSGKIAAIITAASSQEQGLATAPTASTWFLAGSGFGPYPNDAIAYKNGTPGTANSGIKNPTGLNAFQIHGRGGSTIEYAHAFQYSRLLNAIEWSYLGAGGNVRALPNLAHYWYLNTASGTESDLIGSTNLTISNTSAGSNNPDYQTFWTGSAYGNQSYTQGSAITTLSLTTKFDNSISSAFTSVVKQLGTTTTPTTTNGSASTASNVMTVNSATGITAGSYITVSGWSGPVPVLFVSGSSLLLGSAQTWTNAQTVTLYAVNTKAFTGLTDTANSWAGTPAAGDVGTYNNCFFRASCTGNSALIADSPLFNIVVASSGAAASFTAGPTLTSTQSDGYSFGATSNQTATWWQGVYIAGSATPTATNLINGTGTGFVSHFSTALTLNIAGSNTSTALTNPIYDVHHCLTNGNGNSAVVSFTSQIKSPPAGKQYQALTLPTISAITKANPAAVTATGHGFATGNWVEIYGVVGMTQVNGFFGTVTVVDANHFTLDATNSTGYTTYTSGGVCTWGQSLSFNSTAVTGDILMVDATDGQGNPVSITASAVPAVTTSSTARQSMAADIYSLSGGAFLGPATSYINDQAPSSPAQGAPFPALFFPLNQQSSQNIGVLSVDPQGDTLTITAITSLPVGFSISGQNVTGISAIQGLTPVTFQWTNLSGEFSQAVVNVGVGNLAVPSGTGLTQGAAAAVAQTNYFRSTFGTQADPNPNPAPSGTVIAQSPAGGQFAAPDSTISFVLSDGTSSFGGVNPPTAVLVGGAKSTFLVSQEQQAAYLLTPTSSVLEAGTVGAASTDTAGQIYRVLHIPSSAIILGMKLVNDANPTGSSYKCGLFLAYNGGLVTAGSDGVLFNGISMDTTRLMQTEVYTPAIVGGVAGAANQGLALWQLLGLASDPSTQTTTVLYDIVITAITPGAQGGNMTLVVEFALPSNRGSYP